MEVRLEYLRPQQIEEAMAKCPALYMPLGTIEWHGRQNIVGLDAVKAHDLCVRAARKGGGLVAPPLFGGMGGLDEPHTFVIEPEHSFFSHLFKPWLERHCAEAVRQGFKAIIIITGHYGASQQLIVRETAVRMTRVLNRPVLGTPEYFLALDQAYTGDHAAFFETSLMMELEPESVDLEQLGDPPHQGVHGRDPKLHATREDGRGLADAIVERLTDLATQMPSWDEATLDAFARAEGAIVDSQLRLGGRTGNIWEAWRGIQDGGFADYPELLVTRRFEEIAKLAETF